MNNLEKKVRQNSTLGLAFEYNRILSLVEDEKDPKLVSLVDAKKMLYIEEELKRRLYKSLPNLPRLEPQPVKEEQEPNSIKEILGSYYKRKSKAKEKTELKPEEQIKFFIKVKNNLNSTIASIPVKASSKKEALKIAERKSSKFGCKNLKFEVS